MTDTEALQIAGQCWCDPETSNIEIAFDTAFIMRRADELLEGK